MEEVGDKICFSPDERSVGLPPAIDTSRVLEAYELVDQLKVVCGSQIQELSGADVHDMSAYRLEKDKAGLIQRFHQLELVAKGLGSFANRELDDETIAGIVENALADIGATSDSLHEK